MTGKSKKIRAPDLALMKKRSERIVMLTAYDATMARLFDQAGVDLLLVGDSLGKRGGEACKMKLFRLTKNRAKLRKFGI
jgi:ketopantoate hydroxymethyltransferase